MAEARVRSIGPEMSEQTGNHVYKLRTGRSWSYQDLSLRIHDMTRDDPDGPKDISPAVLRNIELGVITAPGERAARRIAVDEAVVLARVFEISLDKLILGELR
jgi:hypothetical protein